jgi:hypothetical protein
MGTWTQWIWRPLPHEINRRNPLDSFLTLKMIIDSTRGALNATLITGLPPFPPA